MAHDRKRAIALKAADARQLLQKHLPYILKVITPAQLAQVQRVLDAEVVNPVIAEEANEVYRKSVIARSGDLVMRDQKIVDRAYRIGVGLLGGAIVTERIFGLDGVGRLAIDSALTGDYPVVIGTTLFASIVFILANFAVDVITRLRDPNLRLSEVGA